MSRRGFALITVLWLVAALTTAVGLGLSAARVGNAASANRLVLTRSRWAAEACLAIAQARWGDHRLVDTMSIDLGRETRCRWRVEDPTARFNVNTVDEEVLKKVSGVGGQGSGTDFLRTVMAHRPFEDMTQVAALPGEDSVLLDLFTVDGPGTVNLAGAPPRVLEALPGLSVEAVQMLLQDRALQQPIGSLDALAARLSPAGRAVLLANYADLSRLVTFASPLLRLTAEGWVTGLGDPGGLHATIEVLLVPLPDRLATVRRRMW